MEEEPEVGLRSGGNWRKGQWLCHNGNEERRPTKEETYKKFWKKHETNWQIKNFAKS